MNSSELPKSQTEDEKTVNIDALKCIRENNVKYLTLLVEPNLLTYDTITGGTTILEYAKKTTGVSAETCHIFLEQQKKVEALLPQCPQILNKILTHPDNLSMSERNLYKISRTIRERLARLTLQNQQAMEALQNKDSLLREILPELAEKKLDSEELLDAIFGITKKQKTIAEDKLSIWQAVKHRDAHKLGELMLLPDFDLCTTNLLEKTGETLLHYAARLGHATCLNKVIKFISTNQLDFIYQCELPAEENAKLTPATIVYRQITANLPYISEPHIDCFHLLMRASLTSANECLSTMLNHPIQNQALSLLINPKNITLYDTNKVVLITPYSNFTIPEGPFREYLLNRKPEIREKMARREKLFQDVAKNKMDINDILYEDLKLINSDGKTLIDVAAEHKGEETLAILLDVKRQEGFVHYLKALDCIGLYNLIMSQKLDIKRDRKFLIFFSSHLPVAKEARIKLLNWISIYINMGIFNKSAGLNHDYFIELFTFIYQHDGESKRTPSLLSTQFKDLIDGIKTAKDIALRHADAIAKTDDIFVALIESRVSPDEMKKYYDNSDLLSLFKNKIIATKDLNIKIHLYDHLFNLADTDTAPQLNLLFHYFQDKPGWENSEQRKLLLELEIDLKKTVEQFEKENEQSAAFDAAVARHIKQSTNRPRYKGKYRDSIPLVSLSFFSDSVEALESKESTQDQKMTPLKPLGFVKL